MYHAHNPSGSSKTLIANPLFLDTPVPVLPPNWSTVYDASGLQFFYNSVTNVSMWEHPDAVRPLTSEAVPSHSEVRFQDHLEPIDDRQVCQQLDEVQLEGQDTEPDQQQPQLQEEEREAQRPVSHDDRLQPLEHDAER